jgi:hypothetical protein
MFKLSSIRLCKSGAGQRGWGGGGEFRQLRFKKDRMKRCLSFTLPDTFFGALRAPARAQNALRARPYPSVRDFFFLRLQATCMTVPLLHDYGLDLHYCCNNSCF